MPWDIADHRFVWSKKHVTKEGQLTCENPRSTKRGGKLTLLWQAMCLNYLQTEIFTTTFNYQGSQRKVSSLAQDHSAAGECQYSGPSLQTSKPWLLPSHTLQLLQLSVHLVVQEGLGWKGVFLLSWNRSRRKRDEKRDRCGEEQSRDPQSPYQVFHAWPCPLPSCVKSSMLLNLSKPQFLHLPMGMHSGVVKIKWK